MWETSGGHSKLIMQYDIEYFDTKVPQSLTDDANAKGKNTQLRGDEHMGADKFRITIELMHEIHHVFDPSKIPVAAQGPPLVVMADSHSCERNIDDNHCFIDTKRFFDAQGKPVLHEAGTYTG